MNAPITHINCLGINFPITRTSVIQKELFLNYLCNHFGRHSKAAHIGFAFKRNRIELGGQKTQNARFPVSLTYA